MFILFQDKLWMVPKLGSIYQHRCLLLDCLEIDIILLNLVFLCLSIIAIGNITHFIYFKA